MVQKQYPQSWSDLPSELASMVLRRLPSHVDRVRFAAVCRHWHFSRRQHCLPPPIPWLGFPDGTFFCLPLKDGAKESFKLPKSASYSISCGDWLLFSRNGTCSLMNPFSGVTLILPNLSSFCSMDDPTEVINGPIIPEAEMLSALPNMDTDISLYKVIVCSTELVAAIVGIGPLRTVAFCRPGSASWFVTGLGPEGLLIDMIFYEGKLYTTDQYKELLAIDIGEDDDSGKLRISRIERLIEGSPSTISIMAHGISDVEKYLVESHGSLLLVQRTIFGLFDDDSRCIEVKPVGVEFKVFEADLKSQSWMKLRSVGDDEVLFVGRCGSRSICMSNYKLGGNCIYFLDDGSCDWFWKNVPSPCAEYNMRDEKVRVIPLQTGSCEEVNMVAAWLFPPG